ncbi:uncharacterized protein TNCV_1108241 [Trichonephila clavipes]|nr:uncharacterized protein TNCV_1108241 [Trichonephila clavipes]
MANDMNEEEYINFAAQQTVSFYQKNDEQNFKVWLLAEQATDLIPTNLACEIINYLARETVAEQQRKEEKPFIDAEIMKEAMLVAADSLFDDFKNKTEILEAINMLQLSARAAARKIELIASNMEAKLENDVETCEFFSIQLDESTDAVDTAQLAISVKMVFDDFSTKEEFLKILPLTARTEGKDIFSLFKKFAIENKLPLQKLSSITMDGARAMTGKENGFIGL